MRSRVLRALPVFLAALSVIACSGGGSTPPPEIIARFDPGAASLPAFLDVPYPSDLYVDPDGTLADHLPGLDLYVPQNAAVIDAALSDQRGFGLSSGALFRIDRADPTADPP